MLEEGSCGKQQKPPEVVCLDSSDESDKEADDDPECVIVDQVTAVEGDEPASVTAKAAVAEDAPSGDGNLTSIADATTTLTAARRRSATVVHDFMSPEAKTSMYSMSEPVESIIQAQDKISNVRSDVDEKNTQELNEPLEALSVDHFEGKLNELPKIELKQYLELERTEYLEVYQEEKLTIKMPQVCVS